MQHAVGSSRSWRNASIAKICFVRRIIRSIWLGSVATRDWLKKKEDSGEKDEKPSPDMVECLMRGKSNEKHWNADFKAYTTKKCGSRRQEESSFFIRKQRR